VGDGRSYQIEEVREVERVEAKKAKDTAAVGEFGSLIFRSLSTNLAPQTDFRV
jgi:hypothetical protein